MTNYIHNMKPYPVTFLFLMALMLWACSSRRQLIRSTETNPKDTVTTGYPFPYYVPRLHYSFQPYRHKPQPVEVNTKNLYEQAYRNLQDMLTGRAAPDFEQAVFISENPYHEGRFTYEAFQQGISERLKVIQSIIAANDYSDTMNFNAYVNEYGRFNLADLRYLPKDKKELYCKALSNWAVFKYLTDTVMQFTLTDSALTFFYHLPYTYTTSDPFGMKDWQHSQVVNLLMADSNAGNCFALTALFKILSDRLNAGSRICTAPQHIYIQHQDPKGHYYNIELATAGHPGDGIIQTLTYTPSEAIMSGVALRDYTTKQSIGLCLVNLAKSYEHKFGTKDDVFMLRCAELALRFDSLNLNALLLKAQVLDARVTAYAVKHRISSIEQLKADKAIWSTVLQLEKHLARLARTGYRQMPTDMQEMIMNPLSYDPKKWDRKSRNPKPFTTIKVLDPKDEEYWSLTKGMFQEVFEPSQKETYGHFTVSTQSGKLLAMDTTTVKGFIIDPVAFAYDFGARIYDARIGHFVSIDPLADKYPMISPYAFVANNPIIYIDEDGREIKPSKAFLQSSFNPVLSHLIAKNATFLFIAGEWNKKGLYNVVLDFNEKEIPREKVAWAQFKEARNEIFGFDAGRGANARIDFRKALEKYNDTGKAMYLIHEFVHLYVFKKNIEERNRDGNDHKHDQWAKYMFLMTSAMKEYSDDNKLGLSYTQIYEMSIVSAGNGATVYMDYVQKMAETNKTTFEVEEQKLQKRVSDIITTAPADPEKPN